MATTYDKASLVMIPSGYKDDKLYAVKPTDGSGDFTFSRDGAGASPATRVNASGLIEKGRENVLLQSNQFDTTWSLVNANLTSGQSGYDGSSNAWLLSVAATTGSTASVRQTTSITAVSTFSVYAKAGNVNFAALYCSSSGSDFNAWFDLGNGVLGSTAGGTIDTTIESVGGGWYRISITGLSPDSQVRIYPSFANSNYSITSGENIYIQDAQLEQGLVATDYIETTTAPVSAGLLGDMPRLDYHNPDSPTPNSCPNLLLEPSRTNAVTNSEYLDSYSNASVAFVQNAANSPEGVDNAVEFNDTATSGTHFFAAAGTQTNGAVLSFFAKQNSHRYVQAGPSSSIGKRVFFDLKDGVMATIGGSAESYYGIEDYGNGWYRCYIEVANNENCSIFTASGDGSSSSHNNYTGDGSGVYLYGVQVESNVSYHTSYIPTYGSASTRAEDYADNAGDASVFNDTEGVLYLESSWLSTALGTSTIAISDGTNSNRIILGYIGADDDLYCTSIGGGSSPSLMRYDVGDITTNHKIAIKYKANDFAFWVDGVERGTQSSGTTPVGLSELSFSSGAGGSKIFGNAKQILYFPTALTDAELASLTTL